SDSGPRRHRLKQSPVFFRHQSLFAAARISPARAGTVCAATISAGVRINNQVSPEEQRDNMKATTSRPITSTRKLARRSAQTALAAGLMLACLLLLSPAAFADGSSSDGTKIEAALSGARISGVTPKGEAEFEQRADGS